VVAPTETGHEMYSKYGLLSLTCTLQELEGNLASLVSSEPRRNFSQLALTLLPERTTDTLFAHPAISVKALVEFVFKDSPTHIPSEMYLQTRLSDKLSVARRNLQQSVSQVQQNGELVLRTHLSNDFVCFQDDYGSDQVWFCPDENSNLEEAIRALQEHFEMPTFRVFLDQKEMFTSLDNSLLWRSILHALPAKPTFQLKAP
jgi:hypothetical protein